MDGEGKKPEENFIVELAKAKNEFPLEIKTRETARFNGSEENGQLAVDVYQTADKNEIIIQATIAGVKESDIDIHITTNSVTVSGARERTQSINEKDYLYQECFWGKFSRSIILPYEVDSENSIATFKNGILTIRLPKLDHSKKMKKLKVETS